MSRNFAAALACAMIAGVLVVLVWPREQPRTPSLPTYSSTVYDPR